MTSVTVAGVTTQIVSPAQLVPAIAVVNKVLAGAGLNVTLPAESTDPVTGTVAISPLQLQVTGTAITNTVIGALNPTETKLELEIGKLLAADNNASVGALVGYVGDAELVAGIVEGIMAGGGVIDLDLGGASADTEAAPDYVNPIGASPSQDTLGQSLAPLGTGSGLNSGSFDVGVAGSPPSSIPASGGAIRTAEPANGSVAAAAPATLARCITSSPSGHPGCWSGAATVGAASLLVVGGALFAADIVHSRRRLIRPKEML
jgi:hypothetical protein